MYRTLRDVLQIFAACNLLLFLIYMPNINTPQLQSEYQRLFDTCEIMPDKYPEIDGYIKQMQQQQSRYEAVAATTSVPWYIIAIIHCMEGSLKFNTHLHNGDPLTARTVQEPKGRPKPVPRLLPGSLAPKMLCVMMGLPPGPIGACRVYCINWKVLTATAIIAKALTRRTCGVIATNTPKESLCKTKYMTQTKCLNNVVLLCCCAACLRSRLPCLKTA